MCTCKINNNIQMYNQIKIYSYKMNWSLNQIWSLILMKAMNIVNLLLIKTMIKD